MESTLLHDFIFSGASGKLAKFLNKHSSTSANGRTGGGGGKSMDWNAYMPHCGLTPLQYACKQNDMELMETLMALPLDQKLDMLKKDLESGMNALAVALCQGHLSLALRLVGLARESRPAGDFNSFLTSLDNSGHCPSESLSFMLQMHSNSDGDGQLLTWGSSSNYSLCHADGHDRRLPDLVSSLKNVIHLEFSKYHVACLTSDGSVYICGHGAFGRLGLGSDVTQLGPCKIPNLPRVDAVALGSYHSLIVTRDGNVWGCGRNDYGQLGHLCDLGPDSFRSDPAPIKQLKNKGILGVAASRIHSVAFANDCVYTWGLNRGQLGYRSLGDSADPLERSPKPVIALPSFIRIVSVRCNEHATLLLTEIGDVYALVNCGVVKLYLPKDELQSHRHQNNTSLVVKIDANQDWITLLTSTGVLYNVFFEGSKYKFQRIMAKRVFDSHFIDFSLAIDSSVLVLTANGKVFHGTLTRSRRTSSRRLSSVSLNKNDSVKVEPVFKERVSMDFMPVPGLKWILRIYSSPSGSFACIRQNYPIEKPVKGELPSLNQDLLILYNPVNISDYRTIFANPENGDMILSCSDANFHVHKLLLSLYSDKIDSLIKGRSVAEGVHLLITDDKHPFIKIDQVSEESIFEFLLIVYFQKYPDTVSDSLKQLLSLLHIDCIPLKPLGIVTSKSLEKTDKDSHNDVKIRLSDGELYANRLILSCRSEFFRAAVGMESLWNPNHRETMTVSLRHFTTEVMSIFIDCCYHDGFCWKPSDQLNMFDKIYQITNVLAIADELLSAGLKAYCENLLHVLIDLKTVCLILSLADHYNALNLKSTCFLFIAANFDLLFDGNSFSELSEYLIMDVEQFIKQLIEEKYPYKFTKQKQLKEAAELENKRIKEKLLNHVEEAEAERLLSEKIETLNLSANDSLSEELPADSRDEIEIVSTVPQEQKLNHTPQKSTPIPMKGKGRRSTEKLDWKEFIPSTPKTPSRNFFWNSPPNTTSCSASSFQQILETERKRTESVSKTNNELTKTPLSSRKMSQKERKAISLSVIDKSPTPKWQQSWASTASSAVASSSASVFPDLNHSEKASASSSTSKQMTFSEIQLQQKKESDRILNLKKKKKSLKQIQTEDAALAEIEQWYRGSADPASGERFTVTIIQ